MAEQIINNKSMPANKLKVYVYEKWPRSCPFCNNPVNAAVTITPKGKSINCLLGACKQCNSHFVDLELYIKNTEKYICLNPEQTTSLIKKRNSELEAKKKRREEALERARANKEKKAEEERKKGKIKEEKDKLIAQQREIAERNETAKAEEKKNELFERIVNLQVKLDKRIVEAFRTEWMKVDLNTQELDKLAYAFFVRNNNGTISCIITTKQNTHKKCNAKGIHIISVRSKLSSKLHSCFELSKKDVYFEVIEKIKLRGEVKQSRPQEDQQNDQSTTPKDIEYSYEGIKAVYVYFRLTNACMKHNHKIESVTAKTNNAKNGQSINVNVFHCKNCDKYFINYEALQKYISRGMYPALPYKLSNDISGSLHDASKLMLYGYRVAEGTLTRQERQSILTWIIDSGLLSKSEIIKDLQFKVRYNGSKTGNEKAKSKWEDDIQFVSRYVIDNKQTNNSSCFCSSEAINESRMN